MIRKIALLVLTFTYSLISVAQEKIIPLNISLWHPVSLVPYHPHSVTYLNLGLPQSLQSNIKGLSLNMIASKANGNLTGINLTGLIAENEGNVDGIMIAGLGSFTTGKSRGLSVAGNINLHLNESQGVQLATLSNFNIGQMDGLQVSAINNFAAGHLHGAQISAGMNIAASKVEGAQITGLLNVSMEDLHGMQIGLANYARNVNGVQIGLINAAGRTVKGVQIGLINYAYEKASVKLGLINVSRATHLQWLMYVGNSSFMNLAARFKNEHFYNQVGIGFPHRLSDKNFSGVINYRAGISFPLKNFSLNGDLGYSHITLNDNDLDAQGISSLYALQARGTIEYQFIDKLAFFLSSGYEITSKYHELKAYDHKPILEFGIALF